MAAKGPAEGTVRTSVDIPRYLWLAAKTCAAGQRADGEGAGTFRGVVVEALRAHPRVARLAALQQRLDAVKDAAR